MDDTAWTGSLIEVDVDSDFAESKPAEGDMIKTVRLNELDLNIAVARMVLSLLALASWYVDPANGGWFFIDESSLIVLTLHLIYSSVAFVLVRHGFAASRLPGICSVFDVAFAAVITLLTEGSTSPSWIFFIFAMVVVDSRTNFRAAMAVTIGTALLYLVLLVAFVPGPRNEYLMRSAYLAITGYLVGFIGAQRARFERRLRELEAAAERHAIARSLHDGCVQALAGVNLRLETCRTLLRAGRRDEALIQLTDLQQGVTREYDGVRSYLRSLADVDQNPGDRCRQFAVETFFQIQANFAGRAPIIEQIFQIALEGVRNTWQHARAARATINISGVGNLICITIDDDGVGFHECEQPPWAIASRVAEYGGWLRIGAGKRGGARLDIEIPA
jgi:signal transduction histidine kinase